MAAPAALRFYAYTTEAVGEENRTFLFHDERKVRHFRINYNVDLDAITIDEYVRDVRAADGQRIESARWRPFLRRSDQDGGAHVRVPKEPIRREEFHLHRNVGTQVPRTVGALDPDWVSAGVDKVNIQIHWPPERGAARRDYVRLRDFQIGSVVPMFGRRFHLYDVDAPTRAFFAAAGRPLPEAIAPPLDDYLARQEAAHVDDRKRVELRHTVRGEQDDLFEQIRRWQAAPKPALREHRAERGAAHSGGGSVDAGAGAPEPRAPRTHEAAGQVLRFWLRPEATGAPDQALRPRGETCAARALLLRYCLRASRGPAELETAELVELDAASGGTHMTADAPVLLRARREWCDCLEMTADGLRPNVPRLDELRVGSSVWLNGQKHLVLACDDATRALLAAAAAAAGHVVDAPMPPNLPFDFSPTASAKDASEPLERAADRLAAIAIGRRGFDPVVRPTPIVRAGVQPEDAPPVLRFFCCLADAPHSTPAAVARGARGLHAHTALDEGARSFVLTVPPDLRLSVRELAPPNSGRRGGLVSRAPLPTEPLGHEYALADFRLGAVVQVCGFRLLLHDAEEATLAWQEGQPLLFPEANVARVLEHHAARLAAQLRDRRSAAPWACSADGRSLHGVVDLDGFLRLLRALGTPPFDSLAGLTMHEAVALFRAFRDPTRPLLELALFERALARSAALRQIEPDC